MGSEDACQPLRVEWALWRLSRRSLHRRISVRAGDITIVREGSGTGEGKASTPGQAHDLAIKGAETDATKRALATFGNPFGLALYDREQVGVRKAREEKASPPLGPWILRSASGAEEASFDKPSEFAGALRNAMTDSRDIEFLSLSGIRMWKPSGL